MGGKWALELPELGALHKSDHNAAKAFMRKQHDDVRMAYARRVKPFPRKCVMWGTTNDEKFLRDPTGNRSYWVIHCQREFIDTNSLLDERDQLWAEALHRYRAMRKEKRHGTLYLALSREADEIARGKQEAVRSEEAHEAWAHRMHEWLDAPVLLAVWAEQNGLSLESKFTDLDDPSSLDPQVTWVRRTRTCYDHLLRYALNHGDRPPTTGEQSIMAKATPMLKTHWRSEGTQRRIAGTRAKWWTRTSASDGEAELGYVVVADRHDYDDKPELDPLV